MNAQTSPHLIVRVCPLKSGILTSKHHRSVCSYIKEEKEPKSFEFGLPRHSNDDGGVPHYHLKWGSVVSNAVVFLEEFHNEKSIHESFTNKRGLSIDKTGQF